MKYRLRFFHFCLALVVASALYLLIFAREAMGWAPAIAVLLHLILGAGIIVPGALAVLRIWNQAKNQGRFQRACVLILILLATASAVTGVYLALVSLSGSSVVYKRLSSNLHTWGSLVLVLVWIASLILEARTRSGLMRNRADGCHPVEEIQTRAKHLPQLSSQHQNQNKLPFSKDGIQFICCVALPALLFLCTGWLFAAAALIPDYQAETYYRNLTSTNERQAENRFFPAGVHLQTGEGAAIKEPLKNESPSSESCGRAGCHPDAYREWLPSAHHFAGQDPFYRKVALQYAAKSGIEAVRWCQGCHAPISVAQVQAEEALVSKKPMPANEEGVGCISCHAMTGTPTRTGNGNFTLQATQDYPFGEEKASWKLSLHDFLLRVRPAPHQRAFMKPELHGSAEFCSSCHRQSYGPAQNRYKFVRGADEYGAWVSGGFSGRSARPPGLENHTSKNCQECHFPRQESGHYAHNSPGGNMALPALHGDRTQSETNLNFMQNRLSLDIFAIRRDAGANLKQEWVAPLNSLPSHRSFKPGETATLDIVVTNLGIGHDFPSGYDDLKEAWIELKAKDERGETLLQSGVLTKNHPEAPPDVHAYRTLTLKKDGTPVLHGERTERVATVFRKSIASRASDIARYKFNIPSKRLDGSPLKGGFTLSARLLYRSLRPDFARWALSPKSLEIPISVLASASVFVPIAPSGNSLERSSETNAKSTREVANESAIRFIRYGSALLAPLENPDRIGALRAFRMAAALAPRRPEPLLGIGNAYLSEPDLLAAVSQFEAALKIDPYNSASRANLALALNKQGQHDLALQALQPLAAQFPQDPSLHFDRGLAFSRSGRFEEADKSFRQSLAANPDSYGAHFQLKQLSSEVLKKSSEAHRETAILSCLSEEGDFTSSLISKRLQVHPEDRKATLAFPEHVLK